MAHVTNHPLGPSLPRELAVAVLAIGPVATVLAVLWACGGPLLAPSMLNVALLGALVLWSPLPVALPAVVLGDARDAALPQLRGTIGTLARAVALIPHLATSPHSGVRVEMLASLFGFVLATGMAASAI